MDPYKMSYEQLLDQLLTGDYGGRNHKKKCLVALLRNPGALRSVLWALAPPGSEAAREIGCTCPILDNQDLVGTDRVIVSGGCKIHVLSK